MASNSANELILYHYAFSPYARKIVWYLTLRGIKYSQCIQPPVLPRPDINALGIRYRRIPLLAIGRDVYCDTRLILQKLEEMFPEDALGVMHADQKAVERLLEKWTAEVVFPRAAQLIPTDLPLLKDPKFQEDRKDYSGRNWDQKSMKALRSEAIVHIRDAFAFLETTLLADGRDWVLKTEKPSLADIEAIWPFHWLNSMPGALPPAVIAKQQFPRTFGYIARFDKAIKAARSTVPKPETLKGEAAKARILNSQALQKLHVDENDPSGLKDGQMATVWPVDSGVNHKDSGRLVYLNTDEIVIEVTAQTGDATVNLHVPRCNYRLKAFEGEFAKL